MIGAAVTAPDPAAALVQLLASWSAAAVPSENRAELAAFASTDTAQASEEQGFAEGPHMGGPAANALFVWVDCCLTVIAATL